MPETISAQGGAGAARDQWHTVADALRERFQRLAELMDASRDDVLVYTLPPRASTGPRSRPPPRWSASTARSSAGPTSSASSRTTDRAAVRLVGALMLEQTDEWAVSRRYLSLESLTAISHDPVPRLPAVAA